MFFERILLSVFCLGIEAFPLALSEEVEIRDVAADKGTNVTVPCSSLDAVPLPNVQWVHRGNRTHHEVLFEEDWPI
uniref:SFRICE_017996 n=1 Tax=Spodoptera frugiperda TaxID=7108 RepID=A0A2H1V2H7_SPOFR